MLRGARSTGSAAIFAALASALLLWASSPPAGLGALAWVALVPCAFLVLRAPEGAASRIAVPLAYVLYLELLLVAALPFGLLDGQRGDPAIPVLLDGSPIVFVGLVAVPLFGALLYLVRFGQPWGVRPGSGRWAALAAVLVPAVAWTALDFLRVKLDPGGLWGPLFLSQAEAPTAGLGALGGPWLITFAIVGVNYGLALALARRRMLPALAAGALGFVALGAGAIPAPGGDAAVRVAAVQPGYDTAEEDRRVLRYWEPGTWNLAAREVISDLATLSRGAARSGAEIVIWPEAVAFVDVRERRGVRRQLRHAAHGLDATIVVPYFVPSSDSSAAIAVTPQGHFTASRPKQRPMWFLGERGGGAPGPRTLQAGGLRLGTMLGVDNQDAAIAATLADHGAQLIASSTHDWEQLATEQRAFTAIGARAAGVPVVRADWRYGSAVYDRRGELVAEAGDGKRRAVVAAEIGLGGRTLYASIGDVFGWGALIASLGAWITAARTRLRNPAARQAAAEAGGA